DGVDRADPAYPLVVRRSVPIGQTRGDGDGDGEQPEPGEPLGGRAWLGPPSRSTRLADSQQPSGRSVSSGWRAWPSHSPRRTAPPVPRSSWAATGSRR